MKPYFFSLALAALAVAGTPPPQSLSGKGIVHVAAGKNCRLVDMCWFKNGKRYCFKKRVCD